MTGSSDRGSWTSFPWGLLALVVVVSISASVFALMALKMLLFPFHEIIEDGNTIAGPPGALVAWAVALVAGAYWRLCVQRFRHELSIWRETRP